MVTVVDRCVPLFAGMNSSTCALPVPLAGDSCTAARSAETAVQVVTQPAGLNARSTIQTDDCADSTADWKYDVHTWPCAGEAGEPFGKRPMVMVVPLHAGGGAGADGVAADPHADSIVAKARKATDRRDRLRPMEWIMQYQLA